MEAGAFGSLRGDRSPDLRRLGERGRTDGGGAGSGRGGAAPRTRGGACDPALVLGRARPDYDEGSPPLRDGDAADRRVTATRAAGERVSPAPVTPRRGRPSAAAS